MDDLVVRLRRTAPWLEDRVLGPLPARLIDSLGQQRMAPSPLVVLPGRLFASNQASPALTVSGPEAAASIQGCGLMCCFSSAACSGLLWRAWSDGQTHRSPLMDSQHEAGQCAGAAEDRGNLPPFGPVVFGLLSYQRVKRPTIWLRRVAASGCSRLGSIECSRAGERLRWQRSWLTRPGWPDTAALHQLRPG